MELHGAGHVETGCWNVVGKLCICTLDMTSTVAGYQAVFCCWCLSYVHVPL